MSGSITSANIVFMLSVTGLYTAPQRIQGFATDDVGDFDDLAVSENLMGVDGKLSAGFVFNAVVQKIALQADSASNQLFDTWYQAEKVLRDKYFANGILTMPSINMSYVMTNGNLSMYKPIADMKKVLQPRIYQITWESIVGAPI